MYESSRNYKRTDAERKSQVLAWNRPDKAFFAAGACHILAYTFLDLHPNEGYNIIGIATSKSKASHIYVSNDVWAFDFNGWTAEAELLAVTEKAEQPDWSYDRLIIKDDLETFCKNHHHRNPAYFLHLPWERAYNYIAQFENKPPKESAL